MRCSTAAARCTGTRSCDSFAARSKRVKAKVGDRGLKDRQAKAELARVNRELRRLRTRVAALEARKAQLMTELRD